jgi:hypothetical protein
MFVSWDLLFLILFGHFSLFGSAQTCYWPDKSVAEDVTPCNSAANNSHCCGPYALCLDNGYVDDCLAILSQLTDVSATASIKAMNMVTGYLAADVQTEHGTAMPVHKIAKPVSSRSTIPPISTC